MSRKCSRTACGRDAVATLTYVYADSVAVLGPLATYAEPHSYDLCDVHAERLTAPRGWEVVRLAGDMVLQTHDDLVAQCRAGSQGRVAPGAPGPSGPSARPGDAHKPTRHPDWLAPRQSPARRHPAPGGLTATLPLHGWGMSDAWRTAAS